MASGLSSRFLWISLMAANTAQITVASLEDLAHTALAQPLQQDVRPQDKLLAFSWSSWLTW